LTKNSAKGRARGVIFRDGGATDIEKGVERGRKCLVFIPARKHEERGLSSEHHAYGCLYNKEIFRRNCARENAGKGFPLLGISKLSQLKSRGGFLC